jgi:hypothetical protein
LLVQQNGGVRLNSTFFLRAELPEFDLFGKHSMEQSSKTRSRAVPNTPYTSGCLIMDHHNYFEKKHAFVVKQRGLI